MTQAPDLLGGLEEEKAVDPGTLDLLSQITEDDGTAWMPWNDEDQPAGVQGIIKSIGTVETDAQFGAVRDVPMVSFVDSEGNVWSFRGYSQVAEGQLQNVLKQGMKIGDHFACRYLGEKKGKKKFDYHNVKVAYAPAT
jgi:hypothetical protein